MALYSQFFFPHFIYDKTPEFHTDFYDIYNSGQGKKRINVIYPREFGKTATCVKITTLHGICYFNMDGWVKRDPKRMTGQPFTIISSQSVQHSVDILTHIKFELEFNDLLNAAFAPAPYSCMRVKENKTYFRWNEDEMVAANSAKVIAVGRGTQIRGKNHLFFRPSLFIGDDLEGERNTTTMKIIEETRHWFFNAVEPSLAEDTTFLATIIIVGTVVHEHCLVNQLRKKEKSFETLYKKAIYEDEDGKQRSLWEEHKPLKMLLQKWETAKEAGRESGFLQEYMNEPISKSERPFNPDTFKYYKGEFKHDKDFNVPYLAIDYVQNYEGTRTYIQNAVPLNVYIGVDPGSSESARADFNVIMVIGVDKDNNVYVLDYWRVKTSIATITINKILELQKDYHARGVCIETVGYQHTLYAAVRVARKEKNQWFKLYDEKHKAQQKKAERLEMMEPRFASGTMHFRDVGQKHLLAELREFPQGDHDDCLDGLWLALREARPSTYTELPTRAERRRMEEAIKDVFDPLTV